MQNFFKIGKISDSNWKNCGIQSVSLINFGTFWLQQTVNLEFLIFASCKIRVNVFLKDTVTIFSKIYSRVSWNFICLYRQEIHFLYIFFIKNRRKIYTFFGKKIFPICLHNKIYMSEYKMNIVGLNQFHSDLIHIEWKKSFRKLNEVKIVFF